MLKIKSKKINIEYFYEIKKINSCKIMEMYPAWMAK